MNELDTAILKTVLYADVFNFALRLNELHHFLISDFPTDYEQVLGAVTKSRALSSLLRLDGTLIIYTGREALAALRHEREQESSWLWEQALEYGAWLARLPFVRMVALTGALSMRNATHADDLDYVLVTAPGRVWVARAFAVLLVKIAKRRGAVICPNYVLAQTALAQTRRDLYIAHEIAQMVPLYGQSTYDAMRAANGWVNDYLPNTQGAFYALPEHTIQGKWAAAKSGLEWTLSGTLGSRLDAWEHQRKLRRFARDLQTPNHAARLDAQQVKGHFRDHGLWVMQCYHERLRRHQLSAESLSLAGD